MRTVFRLALMASLCACAHPRAETVIAEGWAPLEAKDTAVIRTRALAQAQRRAVEKVSGVTVRARTKVDAAVAVQQKITADARGRIARYDVLEERRDGGFLKMRIRAVVLLDAAPEKGESFPPDLKFTLAVPPDAEPALRRILIERGGLVVDAEGKPDLLIRGTASTLPVHDPRVRPFHSCRARLTVEAVDTATGAVLWSGTQEAAALGADPESASASAVASAAAVGGLAEVLWNRF